MKKLSINIKWSDGKSEIRTITRCSRWIKIKQSYNIRKSNSLYEFCTDGNGYHPYDNSFDDSNGTYLDYFTFKGKKYAIEQFFRTGSMYLPVMYQWHENGDIHYISGVDMYGDLYKPIMIELDEYGENVRIYQE